DELSVDQMDGPQVWLLELINWHPQDTHEHVEQLIARYQAFGPFMDQYLEVLQDGIRDGRTAPTIAVERVQAQLQALLSRPVDEWPLLAPAEAQPALAAALQAAVTDTARPAYSRQASSPAS